ncbi:RNA 3'-terminal phosphate cyclase [Trichodelitschia bisporula]|uniref:RNA 3'-terminal phosphate cyclase n=1 Tax=Trichodelitschia bisporula TaxID=703511 RepID=A0A6G1HQC0_9PEZI|nr:RNA 3'-terminal phosphate cyclase [Trichodelitschia bisporula]
MVVDLLGTTLEGGGQLLRLAVGLSALTGTPVRITDIRGNRSGPRGIKGQHLSAVRWLADACSARVEGDAKGSRELLFRPKTHVRLTSVPPIDIGSPGSVTLVFQALLPFILFASENHAALTIHGGTNVSNSPSIDYVTHVLVPMLHLIGLPPLTVRLHRRGWSTGRNEVGEVTFGITPLARDESLPAFTLVERGEVVRVLTRIVAPSSTARMFTTELAPALGRAFPGIPVDEAFEDSRHPKRLYLLLIAVTSTGCRLGRDWLFDRKATGEVAVAAMVKCVVKELSSELAHGGCVDEHMHDQLVVFQAVARGRSAVSAGAESLHTQTAKWVAWEVAGVDFDDDTCEGVALVAGDVKRGVMEELEEELQSVSLAA